jgi:hypothetical protein
MLSIMQVGIRLIQKWRKELFNAQVLVYQLVIIVAIFG